MKDSCLTANEWLLQTCVVNSTLSYLITLPDPGSFFAVLVTKKEWELLRGRASDLSFFPLLFTRVTWLILPVVICLSQRLSHACLSINNFILWNCERLITSAIIYLMVSYYMDNCSNSRANTCAKSRLSRGGMYLLDKKPMRVLLAFVLNHSNFSDAIALCWA